MSFLFGAGRGRRDPRLVEGRRRAEVRLARDINDTSTLNRMGEGPPRRRFPMWPAAVIGAVMVLGAFGLLPHVHRFELTRSCTTPALALEHNDVPPGFDMEWKGTGPPTGDYVLVADGGQVTVQGDTVQVDGGTALSPVFRMTDCMTDQTLRTPATRGTHDLRLMRDTGAGFTEVTSVALTVK